MFLDEPSRTRGPSRYSAFLRCHREIFSTVINSVSSKLKLDAKFEPCPPEAGDELFPNGIFEFNISRLVAFIHTHPERFPLELLELTDIPNYGDADLDEAAIGPADSSRPILLAEIAPGRYNVIDGHHRIAKARREGIPTLTCHRLRCPEHVPFLTSATAYEKYVEYWNTKVDAAGPDSGVAPRLAR